MGAVDANPTEEAVPRRLGPKRATRIRKLFALDKADKMEKQYRLKREVAREGKKPTIKMPKIQRLVTPQRLQVRLPPECACVAAGQRQRRPRLAIAAGWQGTHGCCWRGRDASEATHEVAPGVEGAGDGARCECCGSLTRVSMLQQQRKRAQRQFARENAQKSREEAKKYHDLVVKRKKEAKKAREEQASKRRSQNSATKSGASATTKK